MSVRIIDVEEKREWEEEINLLADEAEEASLTMNGFSRKRRNK